jgi:transposase
MIFLPRAVRVYFATAPVNLRKSFDGLSNEVRAVLVRDPLSGHVFVFLNKRRNQVKLLVWTRGGLHDRAQATGARDVLLPRAGDERGDERADRRARADDAARGD